MIDENTSRYLEAGEGDFNIADEVEKSVHISIKKISLLREFLVTQMNNFAFFPLAAVVFCVGFKNISPIKYIWLAISIFPYIFYLLRIKFKSFLLLLISHIAVVIAARLVFANIGGGGFYTFAVLVYALYSFVVRMKSLDFQDNKVPLPLSLGISAASLFLLNYFGYFEQFETAVVLTFIVSFGLSLLITYIESYINFLIVNRSSTGHIPAKEIFFSGSGMSVLCVIMMMGVLLLTSGLSWLRVITDNVWAVISAMLRYFFAHIDTSYERNASQSSPIEGGFSPEIYAEGEPALIWKILTFIAAVFIICGIIYLIITCMKKLIGYINERMAYSGITSDDTGLGTVKDIREKCVDLNSNDTKKTFSLKDILHKSMDPKEKIRRAFKKYVLANAPTATSQAYKELSETGKESPGTLTSAEWGKIFEKEEIAPIYDLARYSDKKCSNDDVKHFKQLLG